MLIENYSFSVPVEQDPVVDVPADGPGQDDFFEVAALLDEVFDGIAVRDPDDILLDDGAVVEYLGNVVAGGADQLYAPLEGLVIGFRAHEGGQEGMVNVDDAVREGGDELVGEHLHVTREHGEVGFVLVDQADLTLFGLALVFFRNWNDDERD